MTQLPQAKFRHDYRAPDYTITDIDLNFELDAQKTVVTAISQIKRLGAEGASLTLNGEDLQLVSLKINGQDWPKYQLQEGTLVIDGLPEAFELAIVNEIHPAKNTALE